MNIRFLETFLWVARLKSFSSAAEKLCTTQAAVSNRIATLERDLGVRLFERDLRSVSLTPQGERALAQAETIVRLAEELRHGIGDTHRLRGRLMIGTIDSIVYAWLPKFLEAVKTAYPDVDIDLTVDTSLNIARLLQEGQVDLGLIVGPLVAPDFRNIELCSYDCHWVASPSLGLHGRALALEEVVIHPLFAYSKGSQPHQNVLRLMETAGLDSSVARIFNSNSLATITRLVRDGMGVAVLPMAVIREMVDREELVVLEVDAALPPLHLHAIYREQPGSTLPSIISRMAADVASRETRATETRDTASRQLDGALRKI
ncbi:LysR family transcriptional regulator [Azorhizobium oxalatiphilum]|uniref:LysR family transcriptional regulator n=1 Tax=Azorhizobium oxalatiphilum TaxID=980631 RepID=A0A917BY57_9HYPH|nr:LysR family transcriptional regulator [Azorhizobium oxalatiphilum]GGF62603.1 LysR family transcriptional regulator [Azorhizobium oxalatiphilum]